MESLLERLLDILYEEKKLYGGLLELSTEKKEAIIGNDLEALGRIVREEQVAVAKIQDRERARVRCASDLERQTGEKNASLQSFAHLATAPRDQAKFAELQASLPGLISQLRALNETNRQLVEQKLKYVQFVMDSLTQNADPASYGAGGEDNASDAPKTSLYDQKA